MFGLGKKAREIEIDYRKKRIGKLQRKVSEEAEMATLRQKELKLKKSLEKKKSIARSPSKLAVFGSNVAKGFKKTTEYAASTQAGKEFNKSITAQTRPRKKKGKKKKSRQRNDDFLGIGF